MIFGYFTLIVALIISAIAAYYSIIGLTAIFSAAVIPIMIMGASLEVGKVTAAIWLKMYWERASLLYKFYLVPAVAFLMLLTSMGIFGFLSKAHSDQSLVSGDSMARVAIYDEKIKIARDNIDANRKVLKQYDEAVDQVMGRSSDEKGADKAVSIRRSQQKERTRLQAEIEAEQKKISQLNEDRAPLAAENRKIESEVGPIKYIAALVYGDNPDQNVLERAVRLVIIIIVLVFDPLALVLILAAQQSIKWAQEERDKKESGSILDEPTVEAPTAPEVAEPIAQNEPDEPQTKFDPLAYLKRPFEHFKNLMPMVAPPPPSTHAIHEDAAAMAILAPGEISAVETRPFTEAEVAALDEPLPPDDNLVFLTNSDHLMHNGRSYSIDSFKQQFPELSALADNHPSLGNASNADFGTSFPLKPNKGDMFLRTDYLPSKLFKWNGSKWVESDKSLTDNYVFNEAYIKHLVDKIASGEYDPDELSETEQTQIAEYLKNQQQGKI
jgi:hypothetical protein